MRGMTSLTYTTTNMSNEFEKALEAAEKEGIPQTGTVMFLAVFTDEKSPAVESLDFCLRMLYADRSDVEWGIRGKRLAARVGKKEFHDQAYQIHTGSPQVARMICRELWLEYSAKETFYVANLP